MEQARDAIEAVKMNDRRRLARNEITCGYQVSGKAKKDHPGPFARGGLFFLYRKPAGG